jgi:molybdopterin converting factor small subunit
VPIACGRRTLYGVREVTMRVRVKLFATLCQYFGNAAPGIPFEVEVPNDTTVADLVNRLKLSRKEVKVFFVNGRSRPIDWSLEPGDEVGIFPLVAGG